MANSNNNPTNDNMDLRAALLALTAQKKAEAAKVEEQDHDEILQEEDGPTEQDLAEIAQEEETSGDDNNGVDEDGDGRIKISQEDHEKWMREMLGGPLDSGRKRKRRKRKKKGKKGPGARRRAAVLGTFKDWPRIDLVDPRKILSVLANGAVPLIPMKPREEQTSDGRTILREDREMLMWKRGKNGDHVLYRIKGGMTRADFAKLSEIMGIEKRKVLDAYAPIRSRRIKGQTNQAFGLQETMKVRTGRSCNRGASYKAKSDRAHEREFRKIDRQDREAVRVAADRAIQTGDDSVLDEAIQSSRVPAKVQDVADNAILREVEKEARREAILKSTRSDVEKRLAARKKRDKKRDRKRRKETAKPAKVAKQNQKAKPQPQAKQDDAAKLREQLLALTAQKKAEAAKVEEPKVEQDPNADLRAALLALTAEKAAKSQG